MCFLVCLPVDIMASQADVVINEIMYNPPNDPLEEELEYVELYNRGSEDVDIGEWRFTDGITFFFLPQTVIGAGEYLVICSDPMALVGKYGIYNVIGPFEGRLSNEGERVALSDNSEIPVLIDEVQYGTGGDWPREPDGEGPSLELVSPGADNGLGGNWRASHPPEDNGTPGARNSCYQSNPPPVIMDVVRTPIAPTSAQTVTVTATVVDDMTVESARVNYVVGEDPDAEATAVAMDPVGDHTYSATLPYQSNGTWVWYTVTAMDDGFAAGWWPVGAPENKAWYRVHNIPEVEGDIVINEILYHNDPAKEAELEWVEVFNATQHDIDLSLWCLKDDEDAHAFHLPMGTVLSAGEYLVLSNDALLTMLTYPIANVVGDFDFNLSDGGSLVRLFNANGLLMDWVEYGDSSPWPDEADGGGASLECINPVGDNTLFSNWAPNLEGGTPGAVNGVYDPYNNDADIVINEIMYHPVDDNDDAQFLELFNLGSQTVDLSGWQFTRGLTHTFEAGTSIPPGRFLVVCKDAYAAQKVYGFMAPAVTWTAGRLDHGGETLALENSVGATVDLVKYNDVLPWPVAADGFGSSLECINPYVDNNHARNWRASSGATYWQLVRRTGRATSGLLCIYMLEPGECLIDEVSVTDPDGTYNYIPNGDFETDDSGWMKTGNHSWSYRRAGEAHSGNVSMHLVATDTGATSTDCLAIFTVPSLLKNQNVVLSFWAKHVTGGTRLYSTFSGGGVGGQMLLAGSGLLCSPGVRNTTYSFDLPPFISRVEHLPSMPRPYEAATVVAEVEDDAEVSSVVLEYKSALDSTWTTVPMHDDGQNGDDVAEDGLYTATTQTYPSQTVVQYVVAAWDDMGQGSRSPYQHDPKPNHAYFVYNQEVVSKLPVYFMTIPNMGSIDAYGNNYHPATFVYQGKVYEDVGVRYRGGTARSYPKKCLKVRFNSGDLFTDSFYNGLRSINLQAMWADKSYLREKLAYDMFKKMGVAYCETRHVLLHINGSYWGLFLELEAPGRRYLQRNGRDDTGNLYKSYNTGTSASGFEKKTNETDGSKADLESFLWGINNTPLKEITDFLNTRTLVDSFTAYNAVGCVISSADQPHKNHFVYHDPISDKWEMFPWDMDLTYGRNYYPGQGVCNDTIRSDAHIFLCSRLHPNYDGFWNRIIDRFFYPEDSPYTEPFRTKMIETTKYILDNFFTTRLQDQEIDSLVELIREEAARDRAEWGSFSSIDPDLDSQVEILKSYTANRRSYLFSHFLLHPDAPRKTRNAVPRNGDYAVSANVLLQPTAYSDPNGDPHTASQWQIREDGDDWTETVLDLEVTEGDLSFYEVPPDILGTQKVYYWRVRHKDATGLWGAWSDATSFAIGIDSDLDGLSDSVETNTGEYRGATNTGTDPRNPDTDGDGLMDGEEVSEFRTNPTLADSDGDELTDWEEIHTYLTDPNNEDTDGDRLPDSWEIIYLLDPQSTTGTDGNSGDPDEDGLINFAEYLNGTNPNDPDTDGDGMDDSWEIRYALSPVDAAGENGPDGDVDGDGLENLAEYENHTSPRKEDTDEDGLGDLWEIVSGLDPNDGNGENGPEGDPDGDRVNNLDEMIAGTDPNSAQSVFAVTSIQPNNPGLAITWRTVPGRAYVLLVSDELGGEWSPLSPQIAGTGEDETHVDESADSAATRYYKVLVH